MKTTCHALLLALAALPVPAISESVSEIESLRAELETLRTDYEARLSELEARLYAAEREAAAPSTPESVVVNQPGSVVPRGQGTTADTVTAGNAFNPQISLILDGNYYHDGIGGDGSSLVGEAFQPSRSSHEHDDHDHSAQANGFNFREAELAFGATVDPYFDAGAYFSFYDGGVEIEEAWFQTRTLPHGLKLKGGRFFSDFGYINRQHPHQWDFVDQNLPYLNLLGDHGLQDNGLQLTWLPDLPVYTLVGAEVLQGDQERFGSFVSDDEHRAELGFDDQEDGPRLISTFIRFGPDLGYDHALQLGASYAHHRQHQEEALAAEGDADLWGFDLVYKYDNPAQWGHRDLKLQAEYLWTGKDLVVKSGDAAGSPLDLTTDGYYLQGVYGVAPRWQMGLRYDALGPTNQIRGAARMNFDESDRWTFVLTWVPSEFSLFRFQYANSDILVEPGEREKFDTFWLQFLLSLGTHGQHRF
jgi:hypothetical protein